jgi:hypothetical protein
VDGHIRLPGSWVEEQIRVGAFRVQLIQDLQSAVVERDRAYSLVGKSMRAGI